MTSAIYRRLSRLEAREAPPLRQRLVWLDKGDPMPAAEPGEQLTVCSWIWGSDDTTQDDVPSVTSEAPR